MNDVVYHACGTRLLPEVRQGGVAVLYCVVCRVEEPIPRIDMRAILRQRATESPTDDAGRPRCCPTPVTELVDGEEVTRPCGEPVHGKGECRLHYLRTYRRRRSMAEAKAALHDRLHPATAVSAVSEEDACKR